jgi:hypothetical protein
LLIRSVTNLYRIDPGIELEGTGVVDVAMPDNMNMAQRRQAVLELTQALEGVAGIRSAASTEKLPLRGDGDNWGVEIEGRPDLGEVTTAIRMVTPGYFETLGITLKQGRTLQASDLGAFRDSTVEPSIVVNEAFVQKFFPDVSPLGRRVATGGGNWGRVIGVVENVAETDLTADPVPTRYYAYDIFGFVQDAQAIAFRTAPGTDAAAVVDGARRAVERAAPGVAVWETTSMRRVFERAVGPARQVMVLVSILTALALTLGAVGIYGVISHFVMRRKRDWGVRIALGLEPTRVVGGILRRGALLVGAGIVIGVAAFIALARLLSSFLYDVGPADPAAIAASTVALLLVGLCAALVPAFRASRTDPAIVLRDQ